MEDELYLQDLEETEEDALSLCDLPIHSQDSEPELHSFSPMFPNSPSGPELFEFSTDANPQVNPATDRILFCGRVIQQRDPSPAKLQSKPRCESFNKSQDFHSARITAPSRSSSLRAPTTGSYRYQSCGSRRPKVLIGLQKILPGMDLNEIRKRQGRRMPVPMFPAADGGEPAIASAGKSHWGLLRPLRCKSHFARVLARATFGCLPLV